MSKDLKCNTEDDELYTDFILTRYLYVYDEVGLSFVESILRHDSLDNCLFWISEIYHSGYVQKSWDLLWFVYLDFYFVSYPGFMKYLHQKHKDFTFSGLLAVVNNLYSLKCSSPYVFALRVLSCNFSFIKENIKPTLYKGRKPTWITENFKDEDMHHFIRDLYTHRYESMVCHSLPKPETWSYDNETISHFFEAIRVFYQVPSPVMDSLVFLLHQCFSAREQHLPDCLVCEEEETIDEKNGGDLNEHDVDMAEEVSYRPYINYKHIFLAVVCLFEFSLTSNINSSNSNITKKEKEKEKYNEEEEEDDIWDKVMEATEDAPAPGGDHQSQTLSEAFLDKDFRVPTSSSPWSAKYVKKRYSNHIYTTWTQDTFLKKTIYLGISEDTIRKYEVNQPQAHHLGSFPPYSTSDHIIPFSLAREAYDYDIIIQWQEKWLYHASKSPLWYSRLSAFSFSINHDEQQVSFLSDDDTENFHGAYPYDPEQASQETVDRMIPRIFKEHKLLDWLNYTFPNNVIRENCGAYSRFAAHIKYRISDLMHEHHVWY